MERLENGLNNQQAWVSAPKMGEMEQEMSNEEQKEAAKRFGGLSLGCLLYAFIYAFCMYQNKAGITFPFFIVATLYFFSYYTKKYCGIMPKSDRFLTISIVILGILTCTTASTVIILFNKWLILFLMCVMVLKTYFNVSGWSVGNYLSSMFYVVFGSLFFMFTPFSDGTSFIKVRNTQKGKTETNEKTKRIMFAVGAGLVLSIPMVFIVGALLCEADAYFAHYFYEAVEFIFEMEFDLPELFGDFCEFVMHMLVVFMLAYGLFVYISRKNGIEEMVHRKQNKWDCIIAITFSSLIGIMYLVFVWIQIAGLFMGALTLPEGYTYAEYARQGFFQLVFVCIFNVCLVLVCINCFEKHKILQIVLTVISLCTYVMLLSSAYRMFLYIREYQLTFLRVLVLWGIVVIAIVMAGVIIAIYRESFPLFSYILIAITSLYIAFAAMHPDYVIAHYNIAQKEQGCDIDEWYLRYELSLDAAGVVFDMYEEELQDDELYVEYALGQNDTPKYISNYYDRVIDQTEGMNLRTFNISKGLSGMRAMNFMENVKQNMEWIKWIDEASADYGDY